MPKKNKKPLLPQKRRARGTGSITRDKRSGGWLGKVPVGRYPDGRTRYSEVRAATQEAVVALMKGVAPPGPEVTVGEWAARWLAGLSVRASTRAGYTKQVTARIVPTLGAERVAALTVSRVRAALNVWRAAGTATANRTLSVGANMFGAAVLDGLAARNPFRECPRLPHEPKQLDPCSAAELRLLMANRHTTAWRILAFLAATGVRIGEAAALDAGDYDAATGRVTVTKTWSADHGTRGPKSKHSRRTITVPLPARSVVPAAPATGPLFPSASGARFSAAQLHLALNRVLAKLGLRRRGCHAIRHGFISAAIAAGAPIADVARHAGHTAAQLVRTYLHPTGTDGVSDVMSAVLGGAPPGEPLPVSPKKKPKK